MFFNVACKTREGLVELVTRLDAVWVAIAYFCVFAHAFIVMHIDCATSYARLCPHGCMCGRVGLDMKPHPRLRPITSPDQPRPSRSFTCNVEKHRMTWL